MRQTTWTPVYFIVQLFYFIALVRTVLARPAVANSRRCLSYSLTAAKHIDSTLTIALTSQLLWSIWRVLRLRRKNDGLSADNKIIDDAWRRTGVLEGMVVLRQVLQPPVSTLLALRLDLRL